MRKLIESNEVYIKAEEQTAPDTLEQAARDVVAERNLTSTPLADRLEAQSQNNEPITVADVKKATGFGEEGSKLVAELANRDGVTFSQAERTVKTAYVAGLTNAEGKKANFVTDEQIDAFTAGKKDWLMKNLADKEHAKNVVVNKESGFVIENFLAENLPSDVTNTQVKTLDLMAKALGVKSYVAKGLKGNAELNRATGEVPIDFNFEREIGPENNRQKVSIVFHAAHEMALHRVVELAPEEGNAFVYAMYNHLAGNEPSSFTLADEKRSAYGRQGVEISLAEAMEEVSANNILYLYNNNETKFKNAIERIANGTDTKAKQGLRKYIDYLNKIITNIRAFLAGKSAQERAEIRAELDEIIRLCDMFETAFANAVENKKTAQAKAGTNSNTNFTENLEIRSNKEYNENIYHSLHNEYNSIGMQWAYHSDTKIGDHKVLYNSYTDEFVLVKATKDGVGFIEVMSGTYEQMIEEKEYYGTEKQAKNRADGSEETVDKVLRNFGLGRNNNTRNNVNVGNRGRRVQNAEVSKGKSNGDGTADTQTTDGGLSETKSYSLKNGSNPNTKIRYSPTGIKLSANEYAKFRQSTSTDYYMPYKTHEGLQYQSCVTDDSHILYIYEDGGFDTYNVVAKIDFANEDIINAITEEIKNGTTYRITDLVNKVVKVLANRRSSYTVYNAYTKKRISSRGNGAIHKGQSKGHTRGTDGSSGRVSGDKRGAGINGSRDEGLNETKSYSLKNKYWHTDLSKSQFAQVERLLRQKGSPEATKITDNTNWYKGVIDGDDLFVIYSTDDNNNPTILYEVKGRKAKAELDILQEILEVIENGKSTIGIQRNIDRLLSGDWVQEKHNMENNNGRPRKGGSNTGHASVLQGKSSKFIGSKDFRNVIENLLDIQKQDGGLNKDKSFSLKWHTDLSKNDLIELMDEIKYDIRSSKNAITDEANWLFTDIGGKDVFAIYSTDDYKDPTLLYESKGKKAKKERDILLDVLEVYKNGENTDGKPSFTGRISEGSWMQDFNGVQSNNEHLGRGSNNRNVGVLQGQPRRNGSPAFRNVIENLFEVSGGVHGRGRGVRDGGLSETKSYSFNDFENEGLNNESRKDVGDSNSQSFSLKENEAAYTDEEYQAFGWARENNILTSGQNADYRAKFADAKVGRAKFNKSKQGEYIIPVSDIYDSSLRGINNVLVFAKGTISNPIITSVIEIYEYDETEIDVVRRHIYDLERRGIQPETGEVIGRYYATDFTVRQQRAVFQDGRDNNDNGHGGRSSKEVSPDEERTDVNYSLKGANNTSSDGARKMSVPERLAKYVKDGVMPTELYNELIGEYGAIPSGEKPHRNIQVPRKTGKNKKVSQTVRTILEAKATPDEAVPTIEKMVEDGVFSYDVYTDKQAISDAESYIKEYGWDESLDDWFDAVEKGEVSKRITAMGWALYNNAANIAATTTSETERTTAIKTSLKILDAMVKHQRSAAQALQATRILKSLSPETQLYGVQKSVSALQNELSEKYGDKAPDLQIDAELAEQFITAETAEERAEIEKEIYKDIGRQMPSRFIDKWNAWRYLAMLGNPRTHIRNIVGNAGFAPAVAAKNLTATAIESIVNRVSTKKIVRGKALVTGSKTDRALLKAAWGDYGNVADMISNGGKYNDRAMANQHIEEGRQIFNVKPLEWARKKNSTLLEVEDMWFAQPHYAYALAQYCKANNITAEQIKKGKAIAPAREYAIKEAQKATYRDTNAFSQLVSEWGRSNQSEKNVVKKAFSTVVEGILPFRKTPANILVRGVEYSPFGLLKGLSYDLYKVSKGDLSASEAIDNISAGLTGTGLLAFGVFLAAQGLVRGHGGDDKEEKEFEKLMGHQSYALELPDGQSITLDWLAPEALPFFVGVNLWEATNGSDEEANLSTILQAVSNISEPMLEMSCLQGLNDLFEGIGYASSNDTSGLVSVISSAATSYLMQGIPTVSGQAERTGEEYRMSTYTEKNDFLTGDMQYTLGKASAKIPFWDYHQIPYIDAWGRKEASGAALKRGLNNFLNPAYTSTVETSKMEKELLRLYESTGEDGVFPSRADKYFTVDGVRKDLSADEYVKYATLKGQKSYKLVSDLVKSKAYKALDDEEKVKAIDEAYDYANQKAKQAISNYKPETWVGKADEFGANVGNYISFKANVNGTKENNGGKISKQEVVDIILDMAQNDSDTWKMYLSMYDSTSDMYAYNKGIGGETYMHFLESLNDVDMPTKSGKYGTYTQAEATSAIKRLDGLSRQEKAALWQSVNTSWKRNPFR